MPIAVVAPNGRYAMGVRYPEDAIKDNVRVQFESSGPLDVYVSRPGKGIEIKNAKQLEESNENIHVIGRRMNKVDEYIINIPESWRKDDLIEIWFGNPTAKHIGVYFEVGVHRNIPEAIKATVS